MDIYEQNLIVPVDGNKEHYVVMKNELILGKGKNKGRNVSGLSLNANKLLRMIISQCVIQDDEFIGLNIDSAEINASESFSMNALDARIAHMDKTFQ